MGRCLKGTDIHDMGTVIGSSISGDCSANMRDLLLSILQLSLTCDRYADGKQAISGICVALVGLGQHHFTRSAIVGISLQHSQISENAVVRSIFAGTS